MGNISVGGGGGVVKSGASQGLFWFCISFFFFFFCFVEELEIVVLDSMDRLRRLGVSMMVRSSGGGGVGSIWERSISISCVAAESCCWREAMVGICRDRWLICSIIDEYSALGMETWSGGGGDCFVSSRCCNKFLFSSNVL